MRKHFFLCAAIAVVLCACGNNEPTADSNGVLKGKFSVSANTQVQFSQGNLLYQASTNTWKFAENQWDFVGDATSGTVIENAKKCDNAKISTSYVGWIDLFGWGTGNAPTKSSKEKKDYSNFADWGTNAISNGGNKANVWRTLTNDEWGYLIYTRPNSATLFGFGSVNEVNGLILLPDNWKLPNGASFTASTTQGLAYADGYYYNSNGKNYSHNTYTIEQWSKMEAAGAVFLPCVGYREGIEVSSVVADGGYWSATLDDTEDVCIAHYFHFSTYRLNPQDNFVCNRGRAVRLVR